MNVLRHTRRLSAVALLAALPVLALAPTASAAHESSNRLDFDAVGSSSADGGGRINYVKGASGDSEETSLWQQSLRFTGLDAGVAYSVVVKRGEGDAEVVPGSRDRTICTFTATATGTGTCTGSFLELRALAVAQLLDSSGTVVAQATRTGAPNPAGGTFTAAAPGEITGDGGCREPEQGGSQCTAPGHS
ncbi:hypothetical protein [Aquipuribacter hungaricus]|uniref:Uncharacterized protein n=1 Tax=Aquipuribacter hungaricus TaxID=545624 RepID=A0ABV7WGP6_9MICO